LGSEGGGRGEPPLPHFHEHMLFKGTASRGVGEIAGAIEGVGGRMNAFTSFDATCYHTTLPSRAVEMGIDVLADVVQHAVFDPEEVAREIEVVLEEIRLSEDEPHHVLSDAVFAAAFRRHPYRAPILGTADSVASLRRQALIDFYRRWYTAGNLVFVAAGDFESDSVLARVAQAFPGRESAAISRRRPAEPPQREVRTALLRRPFERACLDLSWHAPAFAHADAALLDLLAFVLGEGESSRLVRRVKEEAGLADRIDAGCYTPLDPGLFGAAADLDPAHAEDVVEAVAREVAWLRAEPVPEDELEKARANFLVAKHWERESVSGLARKLGAARVLAGDPSYEETYLARIRTASAEELLAAARRWLRPEAVTVTAVVPKGAEPALEADRVARALARGAEAVSRALSRPRPAASGAEVVSYVLDNGIRLHVAPRREIPVVSIRAALLGGLLGETEETAGISHFLAGVWVRGTASHSAEAFARRVESLAADIDGFSGRSSTGLTLDAASDRLRPALDLFAEVLVAPAFDADEIERERRETLAALARREDRPGARVFDLFARTHFRAHPYRYPIPGFTETVARFDAAALAAQHGRLVRGDRLVIAAAGDVDPDELAAQLARRLGGIPRAEAPFPFPAEEPPPREVRRAEERKDRAQAHLLIGFRGLSVRDPDREALELVAQLLGGQGGRLFLELRDRQGLAYSVSAANVEALAPGFFAVSIATAPEKYEEAVGGILAELRRLIDEPPAAAELDRARRYLIGNLAIDRQRAAHRAMHTALDDLYGLGPEAEREAEARIEAVSREDVLSVARRVFDLSAYTLAAVRPDAPGG
jgi:zinc protease